MPLPGGGPLDRIFRTVLDEDEQDAFGQNAMMSPRWPGHGAGMLPRQSGYQVHQDDNGVQVDVDLPGVAAKDIQVRVWDRSPSCTVQWTGERAVNRSPGDSATNQHQHETSGLKISDRIRLGPSFDCEQLAANLSRGVLSLTAPLKPQQESSNEGPRSIPISTNRD